MCCYFVTVNSLSWHFLSFFFETVECFTLMLSFSWLFSSTVYVLPSICWTCKRDFDFIFSIKSCWSVDCVCLVHDSSCEHGADVGHYILQKKIFLLWTFFCISDFVICSVANLYKVPIISFYATWNGSNCVQFHVMSEHNCQYCGVLTELHWFAEQRA
jgi:hypothetical protein